MKKIAFIGMGNMAQALAQGFISSGAIQKESVFAFAPNQQKLVANAERIGFVPVASLKALVSAELGVDTFFMACKPYQIEAVLEEIGKTLCERKASLVSVAAGWPFASYENYFHTVLSRSLSEHIHFQFVMPNTPAMVGEGVFLFEERTSFPQEEREALKTLFGTLGLVKELPSSLMGIGGAISGCGPAFVDLFMEAYADAAVKYGIPRKTAYEIVSKTVLGSASLCLKTGEHPAVLKDAVCSPAGTTICGVAALEEKGLRAACLSSIDAIMQKKN